MRLITVKDTKRHGFAKVGRQAFEFRGGRRLEIERVPHLVAQFQEPAAERIGAEHVILADQTERHQGVEDPNEGGFRELSTPLQLGEPQGLFRFSHQIQNGQPFDQSRGAGGDCFRALDHSAARIFRAIAASSSILSIVHCGA